MKVTFPSWSPCICFYSPGMFENNRYHYRGAKLRTNILFSTSIYIQSETRLIPPSSLPVSVRHLHSWTTELRWCDWRWSPARWKVLRGGRGGERRKNIKIQIGLLQCGERGRCGVKSRGWRGISKPLLVRERSLRRMMLQERNDKMADTMQSADIWLKWKQKVQNRGFGDVSFAKPTLLFLIQPTIQWGCCSSSLALGQKFNIMFTIG